MDQSTDVEKAPSRAAVQVESHRGSTPHPSPPSEPYTLSSLLDVIHSATRQQQSSNASNTKDVPAGRSNVDPRFEQEFAAKANAKMLGVVPFDLVEKLLMRRVVEVRLKLMQDQLLLAGTFCGVDFAAIDAHVEQHSRALQALEMNRNFEDSFWKPSDPKIDRLARHAAKQVTLRDYAQPDQQANACQDDREFDAVANADQQLNVALMRTRLKNAEEDLLHEWDIATFVERVARKRVKKLTWIAVFLSRLKMAVFGGLALLVPMMIMVLHPTKLTSLLTTGICVLCVGIILAIAMHDAESKDILGATAAYAAVLVVFVGTSNTTSDLSDGVVGAISGGVLGGIVLLTGVGYVLFTWKLGTNIRLVKNVQKNTQ